MTTKILIAKPSKRSLWETKLSENGPDFDSYEHDINVLSYELRLEIFNDNMVLDKTITVGPHHYKSIFQKYSMDDLKAGIRIYSIFSILESIELDGEVVFEEEVSIITQRIANELPNLVRDIDSSSYPSEDLKKYIEQQILGLKNKFKIQPK